MYFSLIPTNKIAAKDILKLKKVPNMPLMQKLLILKQNPLAC